MKPEDRYDSLLYFYSETDRERGEWVTRPRALDFKLLKAQAKAESAMNPRAISRVGAMGLFQFMPPTWNEWAERKQPGLALDPFNPEHSVFLGCAYMEWLLNRFEWDHRRALAAYNCGIGVVRALLRARGELWEQGLPAETSDYLRKIMGR